MYIIFDINDKKNIPNSNEFIIGEKLNNKIISNSYFISFKYIQDYFTYTSLVYFIPYLNYLNIYDEKSKKNKNTFYISKEVQQKILVIEKNILEKYIQQYNNKNINYKLVNKLIKCDNKIILYNEQQYIYNEPLLCIKIIGICEDYYNNISLIYKFFIH